MTIKILALSVLLIGCSTGAYKKGRSYLESGDYASAIFQLSVAESVSPENWQIKRDLGIAYFKNSQTRKAKEKLLEVFRLQKDDKLTLLYLGQCYEKLDAYKKGITVYEYYSGLRISAALRDELNARIREMERKHARTEARLLIKDFQNKLQKQIKPNTIATLYFRNVSNWKELAPLIKGLSEVLTFKLQGESGVNPITRLRMQSVLEQLNLSSDEFLDRYTMTQIAELLHVSYMIGGGIERISDVQVEISMGLLDGSTGQLVGNGLTESCSLSDILSVVMNAAPKLLAQAGVKPTEDSIITQNNLAFIAFSKGLDYEDKLLFPQARQQYQKAVALDPRFLLARTRLARLPKNRLTLSEMEDLAFHFTDDLEGALQLGLN